MITSLSNQKVKKLVQWNQKAKQRKEDGIFIAEGRKMFEEAPVEWVKEVYVSESFFANCTVTQDKNNTQMSNLHNNMKKSLEQYCYEIVSDEVFKKISNTMTPQGILCVLKQPSYSLEQMLQKKNPLLVVLEDIQDPGNLGTIFRTGEGAGIDGIIMSRETVDLFNPKVIRSTMGSIYRMPFIYTDHLQSVIAELKKKDIEVYAAHLKGKNYFEEQNYTRGCAFLIGNEGNGLKKETADAASAYIKIPMEGNVESLNAAIATSLLMYEAHRQRYKKD